MLPQQLPLDMMQNKWAAEINPVLSNPMTNPGILKNIQLVIGSNTINHLLGKTMQGWFVVDQNAVASLYRSQPLNNLTLTLTSDAVVTVSLAVF